MAYNSPRRACQGARGSCQNTECLRWLSSLILLLSFQVVNSDYFRGLLLLLVHYLGIDLGGLDIGVAEHFADGVDVGAASELQGGVCVTEAMESDVAGDACGLNPTL